MNQPKQPQGNFKMNLNFRRKGNEKAPPITGSLSTPENPDEMFSFSAFEHTDKNGEAYWIGPVDMNRSMRQALNATQTQGEHFVAIRENGFKVFKEHHDGTPNDAYAALSPDQQKHEDAKPAYWATWTRTATDPQLRASAWERDASRYGPWASGNTQHPLTKEQAEAMHLETQRMEAGDVAPARASTYGSTDRVPFMDEAPKARRRGSKADDAGR